MTFRAPGTDWVAHRGWARGTSAEAHEHLPESEGWETEETTEGGPQSVVPWSPGQERRHQLGDVLEMHMTGPSPAY